MSDEMMTYQEQESENERLENPPDQTFATIGGVYNDGVSLIFDGESSATTKHYKCNTFFKYSAGDRVYILKDSGTYVVICVIGSPASRISADTAAAIGSSSNYAGECFIHRLNIGTPSNHWVITNGTIFHINASGSAGYGIIGADYPSGGTLTPKPINYLNINGNVQQ